MSATVVAWGIARFGRRSEPLVELLAEAGDRALEGIGRKTIDHLLVGNMAAGALTGEENLAPRVAERLGLEGARGMRIEAASATGAAAFHAGVAALLSGGAERVLVVAGEKMTDRPTSEVARVLAHSLSTSEQAVGATMPALAAVVAQRYLERFHLDEASFDAVSVQARRQGTLNEFAHFRAAVSPEEVRKSRPVALPLRLLHCAPVSDGAAAVVLERGAGPATVLGLGQGFDAVSVVDRSSLTSFRATRVAAQRAYETARLTRKEVDFAELHDAFAPFALIDLEDIGVVGAGEAAGWFASGATRPEGRFPVNASGGLLARGHPIAASGLVEIAEVARQLRGEGGATQLPRRPSRGLALSIGGLASHNFVTILGEKGAR